MYHLDLPEEVREFKKFVQTRQGLVNDVRRGKYNWQELYDRWHANGESDPLWNEYEPTEPDDSKSPSTGKFSNLFDLVSKLDIDQVEKQVSNLSKTIDQVQGFLKKQSNQRPYHHYNQRKRFF